MTLVSLKRTDRTVRALDHEIRRWETRAARYPAGAFRSLEVVAILQRTRRELVGAYLRPYLVNLAFPGSGIYPPGRPRTRPRRSPGRKESK